MSTDEKQDNLQVPIIYHAWYSNKQELIRSRERSHNLDNNSKCPGCIYWVTPDGSNVETTMVTRDKHHNCNTDNMDDLIYQGKVVKYGGVCRW